MDTPDFGFPLWLRITHFFNFLFMTLLVRSGIEIIGAHPRFYWNNDCEPGSEWLSFLKRKMPKGELWTAEDEIKPLSPWLALPGKNNLGSGATGTSCLLQVAYYRFALRSAAVFHTPVAMHRTIFHTLDEKWEHPEENGYY